MADIGDVWYEKHTVVKLSPMDSMGRVISVEDRCEKVDAIEIPYNATNGDMLCKLFQDAHIEILPEEDDVVFIYDIGVWHFPLWWWNAPYKLN